MKTPEHPIEAFRSFFKEITVPLFNSTIFQKGFDPAISRKIAFIKIIVQKAPSSTTKHLFMIFHNKTYSPCNTLVLASEGPEMSIERSTFLPIAKGIGKVYCKGTPFFAEVETRRIVRRGKLFLTLVPLAKDVLGLKRKIQVSVAIGY